MAIKKKNETSAKSYSNTFNKAAVLAAVALNNPHAYSEVKEYLEESRGTTRLNNALKKAGDMNQEKDALNISLPEVLSDTCLRVGGASLIFAYSAPIAAPYAFPAGILSTILGASIKAGNKSLKTSKKVHQAAKFLVDEAWIHYNH